MSGASNGTTQGFPYWGKVTNPDGSPTQTFYRFLINLWLKTGGALPTPGAVFLAVNGAQVGVYLSDGTFLGNLQFSNPAGLAAEPQAPVASPFLFSAPVQGTLLVESGQVEVSRDKGVTFYIIGLAGGAVPLLQTDQARVTWYNAAPTITFLPTGE